MKKIAIGVALLGLCCLVFFATRNSRYYIIAHAQEGNRTTPYTIEMNLYDVVDGKETLQYPTIYAQKSDGMHARLSYAGGTTALGQVVRDIDYYDGRKVILFDKLRAKAVRTPEHLVTLQERAVQNSLPCDKLQSHGTTKLREDTFLGFPVTVVLMRSGNSIRVTHWRAAAFGCMSLKYTVERLGKDGTTWNTTYEGRATSAKLGEPDARLFNLGAD